MEAREIKTIGNYYKPTDGSGEVARVTADDLKAWSMGAVYGKSIPLTEEWLVKLGLVGNKRNFIKENLSGLSTHDTSESGVGVDMQINIDKKGNLSDVYLSGWDDTISIEGIQYVHQLQNLYFALTGEELTYES